MKRLHAIFLALSLASLATGIVLAAGGPILVRQVVSGGASVASTSGGGVRLNGTLGQPVAGVVASGDGDVSVGQGFWHGGAAAGGGYEIYLPLVLRNA